MNDVVKRLMQYIADRADKGGASYDAAIGDAAIGEPWQVVDAWERITANGFLANLPASYAPHVNRYFLTGRAHMELRKANEQGE